jgi:IS6 family transposase
MHLKPKSDCRWYWRNPSALSPWHIDETYVKMNGRWACLFTTPKQQSSIPLSGKDFKQREAVAYPPALSIRITPRHTAAHSRGLNAKAAVRETLNTDKSSPGNNVIECDHGKLKRIISTTRDSNR